ncbi:MAG: GTPase HflX, partial [Chitinophagales bacterium]|nr:GTPase HflX [Chitinophagales bacterium]
MKEKKELFDNTYVHQETAVLVAVSTKAQTEEQTHEYLDELEFLAMTAGIKTLRRFTQNLPHPDNKSYLGKGKLEEISRYVEDKGADLVIIDDEISPSQQRNIEQIVKKKVMDRSMLILEIFSNRAQTVQARTQVELAQLQYMLPRLKGMWTHLERQRGGTGTRGGAGEKEIETDRRMAEKKISVLKEKLKEIDKQNFVRRKNRGEMIRVALVGYTNVGKS